MADVTNVTYSEFADLTRHIWIEQLPKVETGVAARLFKQADIPNGTGNTKRYDEYDTEMFASLKPESANAVRTLPNVGYNVTMTFRRFAKEVVVSYEARSDNRYPEVYQDLVSLAHFGPQRLELDLTHILSFITATTYTDQDGDVVTLTGGDGLAIASASHTLNNSTATWTNIVTNNPVLAQGSLETAENLMVTEIMDNNGNRRVLNFNTLVVADDSQTKNTAKQILQSTADVDAVQAGVLNVYHNKYELVVLPRLASTATGANDSTKSKYWFLIARGQWQAHLGMREYPNLKTPSMGNNGEDPRNDDWTFGMRIRYGIRVVSGKGAIFSAGTGS